MRLHIICINRFEVDWVRFLEAYGGANHSEHRNWSWAAVKANERKPPRYSLQVRNDTASYLRHCMYPYDMALYERLCL